MVGGVARGVIDVGQNRGQVNTESQEAVGSQNNGVIERYPGFGRRVSRVEEKPSVPMNLQKDVSHTGGQEDQHHNESNVASRVHDRLQSNYTGFRRDTPETWEKTIVPTNPRNGLADNEFKNPVGVQDSTVINFHGSNEVAHKPEDKTIVPANVQKVGVKESGEQAQDHDKSKAPSAVPDCPKINDQGLKKATSKPEDNMFLYIQDDKPKVVVKQAPSQEEEGPEPFVKKSQWDLDQEKETRERMIKFWQMSEAERATDLKRRGITDRAARPSAAQPLNLGNIQNGGSGADIQRAQNLQTPPKGQPWAYQPDTGFVPRTVQYGEGSPKPIAGSSHSNNIQNGESDGYAQQTQAIEMAPKVGSTWQKGEEVVPVALPVQEGKKQKEQSSLSNNIQNGEKDGDIQQPQVVGLSPKGPETWQKGQGFAPVTLAAHEVEKPKEQSSPSKAIQNVESDRDVQQAQDIKIPPMGGWKWQEDEGWVPVTLPVQEGEQPKEQASPSKNIQKNTSEEVNTIVQKAAEVMPPCGLTVTKATTQDEVLECPESEQAAIDRHLSTGIAKAPSTEWAPAPRQPTKDGIEANWQQSDLVNPSYKPPGFEEEIKDPEFVRRGDGYSRQMIRDLAPKFETPNHATTDHPKGRKRAVQQLFLPPERHRYTRPLVEETKPLEATVNMKRGKQQEEPEEIEDADWNPVHKTSRQKIIKRLTKPRLKSTPRAQFIAQTKRLEYILFQKYEKVEDPRIPTTTMNILCEAREIVKSRWKDQGIWSNKYHPMPRENAVWKHELPQVDITVEDREASKPCHQFLYQVDEQRKFLQKQAEITDEKINYSEISVKSFQMVKKGWKRDGIWHYNWTVLPGDTWMHEEDIEEQVDDFVKAFEAGRVMGDQSVDQEASLLEKGSGVGAVDGSASKKRAQGENEEVEGHGNPRKRARITEGEASSDPKTIFDAENDAPIQDLTSSALVPAEPTTGRATEIPADSLVNGDAIIRGSSKEIMPVKETATVPQRRSRKRKATEQPEDQPEARR